MDQELIIKIPTLSSHKLIGTAVELKYVDIVESQLSKKCRVLLECVAEALQPRHSLGDAPICINKLVKCVEIVRRDLLLVSSKYMT